MKFKDLLNESATDLVARFYLNAANELDERMNPENVKYKKKNDEFYKEYFAEWFSEEVVPVFTKPTTEPQPPFTNQPKPGKLQSAGYRGKQIALAAAGLPYDKKVQRYDPNGANIISPNLTT